MDDHRHLTADLIREVDLGQAPLQLILEAVKDECPGCMAALAGYLDASQIPPHAYDGVWRRCRRRLGETLPRVRDERQRAEEIVDEIAGLPARIRHQRLAVDPGVPERALVERLLEEARSSLPGSPDAALSWATDALVVLDRQTVALADQRILALAHQANAYRATAADLPAAARGFARARRLLEDTEDTDLDTAAELDSLEASLFIALRRFEDAQRLLERALSTYQELGQVTLTARTLIKLGHLFSTVGAVAAAEMPYRAALQILSPRSEPELYLAARFNLAHTLFELGKIGPARDVLAYDEDLFERHSDRHTRLRRNWLLGRIAEAAGDLKEAEELLAATRDAFAAQADGFDAALVSLDMAVLYLRAKRHPAVVEAVSVAVELFTAYALHREALAALITLRDSVRQETATADTILQVAAFLREAGDESTARRHQPS